MPTLTLRLSLVALLAVTGVQTVRGQPQAASQATSQTTPTFRASVDLVTTDLLARDRSNRFVADLKPGEVEIYEDGVKQTLVSFVMNHGQRNYDLLAPPAPPSQPGIILPERRADAGSTGRLFLIVIDDLHLQFADTVRARNWLRQILRQLIHDGDMFGIVSTGHSSISEPITYDRQVLESAIDRVAGGGLTPKEMIEGLSTSQGPAEVRHRAQIAFATTYELIRNLEKVQNRRKAVLYISSGFDFDPFVEGRLEEQARRAGITDATDESGTLQAAAERLRSSQTYRDQRSTQQLSATDLTRELYDLAKAANRSNATFYPIDPTGLVAGPGVDQEVNTADWLAHTRERQHSLRTLAELTGGFAIVNSNDLERGLQQIDDDTSDYYVLGYYSTNADPLRRTRRIEVRTTRPDVTLDAREFISLKPGQR